MNIGYESIDPGSQRLSKEWSLGDPKRNMLYFSGAKYSLWTSRVESYEKGDLLSHCQFGPVKRRGFFCWEKWRGLRENGVASIGLAQG